IIAGAARTAQQADTYSNALLILMGIMGGTFFNLGTLNPSLAAVGKLTLNYWSINAYSTLAQTNSLTSVLPNIIVLLIIFVVFFGIGLMLFNRRLKV
ncbi:MAG TPA: hypothetical protein VKQ72_14955, partial [Aggregatilineales bacterium]|nr:hypothetical protein [Aggregatilineales bacterium]